MLEGADIHTRLVASIENHVRFLHLLLSQQVTVQCKNHNFRGLLNFEKLHKIKDVGFSFFLDICERVSPNKCPTFGQRWLPWSAESEAQGPRRWNISST